eukprot:7460340-Pyramimonas_sp.AAC.1
MMMQVQLCIHRGGKSIRLVTQDPMSRLASKPCILAQCSLRQGLVGDELRDVMLAWSAESAVHIIAWMFTNSKNKKERQINLSTTRRDGASPATHSQMMVGQ